MGDKGTTNRNLKKAAKLLSLLLASVLCLLLLFVLAFRIYLSTSFPAPQLSRLVTSSLKQDFSVQEMQLVGPRLVLKKVRLKNPAGFSQENLFSADAVTIVPRWLDLLLGRQRFQSISVEKGKLDLEKNSAGTWNFAALQQRLAERRPPEKKRPAVETFIDRLQIRDGAVSVQGEELNGISLQLFNLATGGSLQARVELAFEDGGRNRYSLKGTARPGKDAALDLTLAAPSLSLKNLANVLKLKDPLLLQDARGALQANAVLVQGELRGSAVFSFSKIQLPGAAARFPVAGSLNLNGTYSLDDDTARLREATLSVDRLARLHAAGSVRHVKKERQFSLLAEMDQADLAMLNILLAEPRRARLLLGGRVRCQSLRIEGDATGLKSAAGTLQLSDGSLAREGQLLVSGLSGRVELAEKGPAVVATGRVTAPRDNKALVESLELPFSVTLSRTLKPMRAETRALSARAMGTTVAGRVAFDATKKDPLSADIDFATATLPELNRLIRRYGVEASSGAASGTLELAGSGAQDFGASARMRLSNFKGRRGGDSLGLKSGALAAKVQRRGGGLQAQGDAQLNDLAFNGKSGDASFGYRVVDRRIQLTGAKAEFAGTRVSVSSLTAQVPARSQAGNVSRYPLVADAEGVAVRQGEMEFANLSGRLRGNLATDAREKWLEGTAEFSSRAVSWQGTELQAAVLHATFNRGGGQGSLAGELLGGELTGQFALNPFAPGAGATFQAALAGARAAHVSRFLPKGASLRPTAGALDLHLAGSYSSRDGVACRFDSRGSGIAVADGRGRSALSGAAVSLSGALAGGTVTLKEGTFSPGEGAVLKAKGEIARAFSAQRRGALLFSVDETAVHALVDSLINLMPPMVQEASLDGKVGLDGKVELGEGRALVEGVVSAKKVRVEVPSQKLVVAAIDGKIPFSLDLGAKHALPPRDAMEFSRENFSRVLAKLRDTPGRGEVVTVGKVVLGTLELGEMTLHLSAANGLTEISSLRTTLYEGAILGKGYLAMQDKLTYRGDLLVNGLSMKSICRTLNMQGYIAGRVDGVISLHGGGGGMAGMTGFVDLWAREGAGEKMLVSKEFLQTLAKQKLSGFFLSSDRRYDEAEIRATLEDGDLSFNTLKIVHTNLLGVRDLNVTIAPSQNRIALNHLLESIKEAALRGKPAAGEGEPKEAPVKPEVVPEFKWEE